MSLQVTVNSSFEKKYIESQISLLYCIICLFYASPFVCQDQAVAIYLCTCNNSYIFPVSE